MFWPSQFTVQSYFSDKLELFYVSIFSHIEDIAVKSDLVQSSVLLSSRLYVVLVAGQSAHLFT